MKIKDDVNKNGITHLVYQAESMDQIVNSFSPDGYEILSDSLEFYLDRMSSFIENGSKILLEFTGRDYKEEEKKAAENALNYYFVLKYAEFREQVRKIRNEIIIFLICTIIATGFIIWSQNEVNELVIQFAYLPFWFFAYRLVIVPFFDYLPLYREQRRFAGYSGLKVIFTSERLVEIPEEIISEIDRENAGRRGNAWKRGADRSGLEDYLLEEGTISLEAKVNAPSELMCPAAPEGMELLEEGLTLYLSRASAFVDGRKPIQFEVSGCTFTEGEAEAFGRAVHNTYLSRYLDKMKGLQVNNRQIVIFLAGLVFSCGLLKLFGGKTDVAVHEGIILLLWFFADYLAEFILIGRNECYGEIRKAKAVMNMSLKIKK